MYQIQTKKVQLFKLQTPTSNNKPTFVSHNLPVFCPGSVYFSSKGLSVLFIGWAGSAWSTLDDQAALVQCQILTSNQSVQQLLYHITEFGEGN